MRHSYLKISHRQIDTPFQSIIQKCWACKSVRVLCFGVLLVAFGSLSHTRSFDTPYGFQGKVIGSRATDSLALVGLAKVTNGDAWTIKWDFSQPLDNWFGVSLNPYGRVKCLDLDGEPDCTSAKKGGNKLKGMMPDIDLPYLEHLFLSGNQLTGQIPDFSKLNDNFCTTITTCLFRSQRQILWTQNPSIVHKKLHGTVTMYPFQIHCLQNRLT